MTTYMGLTLPTVLDPLGAPTYAVDINGNFNFIDVHDHTTNKGCKVPVAGLNLNADIDLSNLYRLKKAYSVGVTNQGSAVTTDTNSVQSVAGNLVWINSGGTAVQITSGAGINLSSLGTIGGDYGGADPASVFYTNATKTFTFTQDSGITAHIAGGDLYIYESVASGKYVHLKPKTGLSANIDLQLPSALPAGNALVTMTSAGVVEAASIVPATAVQSVLAASATGTLVDQNYYISQLVDLSANITLTVGGGSISTINSAKAYFYRLGSTWKMNFNLIITLSATSRTQARFKITNLNAIGYNQAISGSVTVGGTPNIYSNQFFYSLSGNGYIDIAHTTGTSETYSLSGDVELATKPTSYLPAGV